MHVIAAEARFVDPPHRSAPAITAIRPRRFVIATGSAPVVPPIPGLDTVPFFTNETVFANRTLPAHLIVIGGGPIGIELAQAHRGLGAAVTVIDAGPILPHDDPETGGAPRRSASARTASRSNPRSRSPASSTPGAGIAVTLATGERIDRVAPA